MEKLSFQDAAFLRMESEQRPFHVAGLMIFKPPENASPNFMRKLTRHCGRLNELWPVFAKKLYDPSSLRAPAWVTAEIMIPNTMFITMPCPHPVVWTIC